MIAVAIICAPLLYYITPVIVGALTLVKRQYFNESPRKKSAIELVEDGCKEIYGFKAARI
jgi:hypothetical protein